MDRTWSTLRCMAGSVGLVRKRMWLSGMSMKKIAAPALPAQWSVCRPHASEREPTMGARKVLMAALIDIVRP